MQHGACCDGFHDFAAAQAQAMQHVKGQVVHDEEAQIKN